MATSVTGLFFFHSLVRSSYTGLPGQVGFFQALRSQSKPLRAFVCCYWPSEHDDCTCSLASLVLVIIMTSRQTRIMTKMLVDCSELPKPRLGEASKTLEGLRSLKKQ